MMREEKKKKERRAVMSEKIVKEKRIPIKSHKAKILYSRQMQEDQVQSCKWWLRWLDYLQ